MVIFEGFLALLAGFATMAVPVMLISGVLAKRRPEWVGEPGKPKRAYMAVNLGYSFLAAMAGGYVTGWIAGSGLLAHVMTLAIGVLVLLALSALDSRGKQPVWYLLALMAVMPLGVLAGGVVRLMVLGVL